ncbi:MAG: hypothetical protein IRZ16_05350 [Myxococcaceae bacterium]|nr:hypothetical protein [Myxococcaceae bacterium]
MIQRAAVVVAFALSASATAFAEEPTVEVNAEVVLASNEGNTIDPPQLAKLKRELEEAGARFTSLKRLSEEQVAVKKSHPASVKLPDGRSAALSLKEIKDGVATIDVQVPRKSGPPLTATYTASKHGSLTLPAGPFGKGTLVIKLSPPEHSRPRRMFGPALRPSVRPTRGW